MQVVHNLCPVSQCIAPIIHPCWFGAYAIRLVAAMGWGLQRPGQSTKEVSDTHLPALGLGRN